MPEIEIHFADNEDGSPRRVPASTTRLQVKKYIPGKAGRSANLFLDGELVEFPVTATASDLVLLPSDDYRFVPVDEDGRRVGKSFIVSVMHMGNSGSQDSASQTPANEMSAVHAELARVNEQLMEQNREMHASMLESMKIMRQGMEQMTKAHVEITKQIGTVVEASAENVGKVQEGTSLSKTLSQINEVWDAAPRGSSDLDTVLKSPLVIALATGLQKIVAKVVQDSTDRMLDIEGAGDNEASRIARRLFKNAAQAGE